MGMNPEIKRQWVRALKGRPNGTAYYEQGNGQLCTVDTQSTGLTRKTLARKLAAKLAPRRTRERGIKRCCLAVLADVAARSGEIPGLQVEVVEGDYSWRGDAVTYDGQAMLLPRSIIEWAGLQEYTDQDGTGGHDVRFDKRKPGDAYAEFETLSNLNDGVGLPFTHTPTDDFDYEGIAELIDRCL